MTLPLGILGSFGTGFMPAESDPRGPMMEPPPAPMGLIEQIAGGPAGRSPQLGRPSAPRGQSGEGSMWSQMNWGERLRGLGAAIRDMDPNGRGGNFDAFVSSMDEKDRRRRLEAAMSAMGFNDEERMLFQVAPERWAAAIASGYESRVLSPGQTLYSPMRRPAPRRNPLRVIDGVLGGRTISESMDYEDARLAGQDREARVGALADSQITDPRERLLYERNPEAWARANQARLEPFELSPGQTRGVPGESIFTAPLVGMDGGVPYRYDPNSNEADYGEPRPLGINEAADNEAALRRLTEDERHNRETERLAGLGAYNEGRRVDLEGQRVGLSREEFEYNRDNPRVDSTGDVIGPIYAKIAAGIPLTPGEQAALDSYNTSKADPLMRELFGDIEPPPRASAPPALAPRPGPPRVAPRPAPRPPGPGANISLSPSAPPRRPAPAPRPTGADPRAITGTARPPVRPARPAPRRGETSGVPLRDARGVYHPTSREQFDRLPPGAQFVNPADGRLMTKKAG